MSIVALYSKLDDDRRSVGQNKGEPRQEVCRGGGGGGWGGWEDEQEAREGDEREDCEAM